MCELKMENIDCQWQRVAQKQLCSAWASEGMHCLPSISEDIREKAPCGESWASINAKYGLEKVNNKLYLLWTSLILPVDDYL